MEIPPKLVGALLGAVATLGAAVMHYLLNQEKLEDRLADNLRDDLHRQWRAEQDLRQEAEARAEEAEERAEEAERRNAELERRVDRLESRFERLATAIEEDPDVDLDPRDV